MGTFYNGANCDIYISKGAGKKLLYDPETNIQDWGKQLI